LVNLCRCSKRFSCQKVADGITPVLSHDCHMDVTQKTNIADLSLNSRFSNAYIKFQTS